ncbi:MAG: macro domain-containing protein [Candidatus Rhabdochlamydia sp.]
MTQAIYLFTQEAHIASILKNGMRSKHCMNSNSDVAIHPLYSHITDHSKPPSPLNFKIDDYVQLILDPSNYLIKEQAHLGTVCAIELNPTIINCSDVVKIDASQNGLTNYFKSTLVSPSYFKTVHTSSSAAKEKVLSLIGEDKIEVTVNSELFSPSQNNNHLVHPPSRQPHCSPTMCRGDLLNSPMQALVNTVNCVGVMGKGIALTFKQHYPEMFIDYQLKCKRKEVSLGKPYCYRAKNGKIIINFPTKNHWKEGSSLVKIEEGMKYLIDHIQEWGIHSIAIPPLGCGWGGLNWNAVFPIINRYLSQTNLQAEIYPPPGSVITDASSSLSSNSRPSISHQKSAAIPIPALLPKDTTLKTSALPQKQLLMTDFFQRQETPRPLIQDVSKKRKQMETSEENISDLSDEEVRLLKKRN